MTRAHLAAALLLVATALPAAGGQRAAVGAPCDRACLTGIADACFAAPAAHDPSKASLAPGLWFTENAQVMTVGEGLWTTASEAPDRFKISLRYRSKNRWSDVLR